MLKSAHTRFNLNLLNSIIEVGEFESIYSLKKLEKDLRDVHSPIFQGQLNEQNNYTDKLNSISVKEGWKKFQKPGKKNEKKNLF